MSLKENLFQGTLDFYAVRSYLEHHPILSRSPQSPTVLLEKMKTESTSEELVKELLDNSQEDKIDTMIYVVDDILMDSTMGAAADKNRETIQSYLLVHGLRSLLDSSISPVREILERTINAILSPVYKFLEELPQEVRVAFGEDPSFSSFASEGEWDELYENTLPRTLAQTLNLVDQHFASVEYINHRKTIDGAEYLVFVQMPVLRRDKINLCILVQENNSRESR
jgi:hypothetical protein